MNAVKDSVGIALPFTLGTALSIWLTGSIPPYSGGVVASCSLVPISLAAAALLRTSNGPCLLRSPLARRLLIGVMLVAAGVFVTFTRWVWTGTEAAEAAPGAIAAAASGCAQSLKEIIDGLPYSDARTPALVKALVTGDRSGIDAATRDAFRLSGASHLLAISGMHLGIIYMVIDRLLSCLGHGKRFMAVRSATIVACSGFFTLMTGASPSIVRAFLFIFLNEAASVTGRARNGIHILSMALVIQLALTPETVRSIGFQLSYLAMSGIFFLYPALKGMYPEEGRKSITGRIWNAAALSIACQAFTAPAVWYHFGTFPQYFILTNLLAVPITTMTMMTSIAVVSLSAFGLCPDFLVTANEAAVTALRFTVETISTM